MAQDAKTVLQSATKAMGDVKSIQYSGTGHSNALGQSYAQFGVAGDQCHQLYPNPDRIFPEFIVHEMPIGLKGLVLASIFAIAMSNASGSLNSLASSSIIDLTPSCHGTSPAQSLGRSRRMTLVWGVLLALLGLVDWGPVLVAGLTITSITYGGLLGVFLLGTWNRLANENGALVGFATGIVTMIAVTLLTRLAWTWYVPVGTIATFAVGSLGSLAGSTPSSSSAPQQQRLPQD